MATGYGRISRINAIPFYKGSSRSNGRTYRGVKTSKMTADISLRLAKAQDTQMKNDFTNGNLSADQYNTYLSQRIAQTSDPTYRVTLTQELQNVVTGTNESQMLDGYKAGTVSAGQVMAYYQSKLQSLTPDNPEYSKTQAAIAQWDKTSTTDAYKAQEAVLKGQEAGATDQLPAAQKLLDFYVQSLQTLTPNSPDYNTTVQAIGTYQAKVRNLTFQQNLLQAEDKISQTYNKNTPEDWAAKAQMYQQLRDQSAQMGDTTNYYKYDQLANNAADASTKAQDAANTKQITNAVDQVKNDYISGKIDGATAQQQLQDISLAADGAGDITGSTIAHDLFNTIQNDITRGVSYGGDNGFGKIKGGTGGDNGWFDAATGAPISGGSSSSSSMGTGSPVASTGVAASNIKSTSTISSTSTSSADLLSKLSSAAKVSNIQSNQTMMQGIQNISSQGGTFTDMVLFLRMQKVGTGDGWQALQDYQTQHAKDLSQLVQSGQMSPSAYKTAEVGDLQAQLALYSSWQQMASTNPNATVNIDGKSTKVGTLTTKIDEAINGHETIDPATQLAVKDKQGLTDMIAAMSDPAYNPLFVQDKNNPSQLLTQAKALDLQNSGALSKDYVNVNGQYFFNEGSHQIGASFTSQAQATAFAQSQGYDVKNLVFKTNTDNTISVFSGKTTQSTIQMAGPNGSIIKYSLDNGVPVSVSVNGKVVQGYLPKAVLSPTDTVNGIQTMLQTYEKNNPVINTSKANAPAVTKVAGFSLPHANLTPTVDQSSGTLTDNLPSNQPGRFNVQQVQGIHPYTPLAPLENTFGNFLRGGLSGVINPSAGANVNGPLATNPIIDHILGPVFSPIVNPVDQLIQNIFKPSSNPVIKPSTLPAGLPLNIPSSQQQAYSNPAPNQSVGNPSQQQNPASPSTPLQNMGSQPQNPLQQSGLRVNLGSAPVASQPAPAPSNWLSNIGTGIGNAFGGAEKAVGNFFGGFHF